MNHSIIGTEPNPTMSNKKPVSPPACAGRKPAPTGHSPHGHDRASHAPKKGKPAMKPAKPKADDDGDDDGDMKSRRR